MSTVTELAGIIADFPGDPTAAARAIADAGYTRRWPLNPEEADTLIEGVLRAGREAVLKFSERIERREP